VRRGGCEMWEEEKDRSGELQGKQHLFNFAMILN
jgi:hypothetical protein